MLEVELNMIQDVEDDRETLCDKCRRPTLVTDIKYVAKGDGTRQALCSKCRTKNMESQIKQTTQKVSDKQTYVCGRCGYRFRFDPFGVAQLRCPYCGRIDKLQPQGGAPQ